MNELIKEIKEVIKILKDNINDSCFECGTEKEESVIEAFKEILTIIKKYKNEAK